MTNDRKPGEVIVRPMTPEERERMESREASKRIKKVKPPREWKWPTTRGIWDGKKYTDKKKQREREKGTGPGTTN